MLTRRQWVNLLHILLVAPLLMYVGSMGAHTPKRLYPVLLALGIIVVIYHTYIFGSTMWGRK